MRLLHVPLVFGCPLYPLVLDRRARANNNRHDAPLRAVVEHESHIVVTDDTEVLRQVPAIVRLLSCHQELWKFRRSLLSGYQFLTGYAQFLKSRNCRSESAKCDKVKVLPSRRSEPLVITLSGHNVIS